MKSIPGKYWLSMLLLCSYLFSGTAQALITVTVDRNPVQVNESFQLFFETDKAPNKDPDFSPLQQLFVVLNTSQSNSISIVNGDYQRSIKWTLQMIPKQVGEFVVPSIRFGAEKTQPFQISVKAASQSTAAGGAGLIFELSAPESDYYVQGQILVSMRLMSDSNISAYQFGDLQVEGNDVVIEPLGAVKQYQTRIADKPYLVLEKQFALFPQQSGELKINPVLAEVQQSTRTRSIFDPFQGGADIKRLRSQGLTLQVLTIPEVARAQYWLPASGLELREDWQGDLTQLVAGEPVTRTLTLVAKGLTAAQLPELLQQDIAGIKQYPDQASLQDQRSSSGIVGSREQKIALIPGAPGTYTLPEIKIPWWNLETGAEQVATLPARSITVAPGIDGEVAATPLQGLSTTTDSAFEARTPGEPGRNRFWVWLSLFLALGWIASGAAWWLWRAGYLSRRASGADPADLSLRRASRLLRQACEAHDAQATRDALLAWGRALQPAQGFANLQQLAQHFGEPLDNAIDELNRSLYSPTPEAWQGDALWAACEALLECQPKRPQSARARLPALNP